jgi:hypothetical protein
MALWRHKVRDLINADKGLNFPMVTNVCEFLTAKTEVITNDIWEVKFSGTVSINITKK